MPLKRTASIIAGQSPSSDDVYDLNDSGRPFLQGNAEFGSLHPKPRLQCDVAPKQAQEGDILISVRAPVGALNIADRTYGIGRGLCAVRPARSLNPEFAWWALVAMAPQLSAVATGSTYDAVTADDVGRLCMPDLPRDSQQIVTNYLDRETERIDALVGAKRKMVKLLEESWTTFRDEQILGDLNPLSGKGTVPSGWQVRNLGATITLQRGHDLPSEQRAKGDVPVVSSGGPSGWHDQAVCQPPGVVTGRYGTIGKTYFVDVPYWPLNTTLYVSDFRGNNPRWTFHMLATLPLAIDEEKSAVTGINRNVVAGLKVPVPSPSEQTQIASEIDDVRRRDEGIQRIVQAQITLLQERRQALITAAVTGQLDIPEAS